MRFLSDFWPWRRARGDLDGNTRNLRILLCGSFINIYLRNDFGDGSFGRAKPAFKCEKWPSGDVVIAIFFGILSLLAKTKALLIETKALLIETKALLIETIPLLFCPMSLLILRKRAIGKNEGE